jgi:hypothetical protein
MMLGAKLAVLAPSANIVMSRFYGWTESQPYGFFPFKEGILRMTGIFAIRRGLDSSANMLFNCRSDCAPVLKA